ncbi:hypothetical protein HB364_25880 [Pseudoflavitalea sp. X16]|uniref:hypothetical protein n=1 Tax=Paraflavitalea devenefica TaxID=2716334 RepID=UPI001423E0B9|nr:hypothetical protein [Paraflavitalea devenefica]NII28540.1 hypothetical protein [Paraflavitalea devenefica]
MEARLNEIERELPVSRQISFDPVQALRQLSRISYLQGSEYPGEVEACDRLLKKMNADRKTMLLLWAGHAAVVYNDCIQQIAKELTTQAELYNKAHGESRTLLDQHTYTINRERSKLGYA